MVYDALERFDIANLKSAIDSLRRSLNAIESFKGDNDDIVETLRAGVIQHFEFTYELCWKSMKRWIEMNVGSEIVDGVTRAELFRISAENKLITDVAKWMQFHKARNSTSHTYNENTAYEVFETAVEFYDYAVRFQYDLEARK